MQAGVGAKLVRMQSPDASSTLPDQPAETPGNPGVGKRGTFTMTDSPCVAVCSTLYDDVCRGCGRTAMEVANWVFMDESEKKIVWQRIRAEGYPRRNY